MKRQLLTVLSAIALATAANVSLAAGDVAAGKTKAAVCAGCHGPAGISAIPIYPNLAGQKETYLASQIKAFKDGTRVNAIMAPMAKPLSDADIANLSAYFASLK